MTSDALDGTDEDEIGSGIGKLLVFPWSARGPAQLRANVVTISALISVLTQYGVAALNDEEWAPLAA
jgi:hypothetical protein